MTPEGLLAIYLCSTRFELEEQKKARVIEGYTIWHEVYKCDFCRENHNVIHVEKFHTEGNSEKLQIEVP